MRVVVGGRTVWTFSPIKRSAREVRATHQSHSFTYRGDRLVYDTYGQGDRLLVYLHGLLIDSEINRGIAEALAARGNRVVLLDLLGHGRSDKPHHAAAYRIDTYASQVFALLDELGVNDAVLGGMSLGANVSLFAASQQPHRVRGLVLEMPVLERAVPFAALLFVPLLLLVHYAEPLLRVTSAASAQVPRTRFGSLDSLVHAVSLPPESMAALLHGILVGPVAPTHEQRSAIAVPALVLAHGNDLLHPFADASRLAKQLPNATLVRARSPLELRLRPGRLTDAIADFLDDVWGTADAAGAKRSASSEETWDEESGRAV
jgi:pimeloyl-ACP methyl ester carboxylesterase